VKHDREVLIKKFKIYHPEFKLLDVYCTVRYQAPELTGRYCINNCSRKTAPVYIIDPVVRVTDEPQQQFTNAK
jgi:hypothetical protein